MKLMLIVGSGAVGKMTVGQQVAKMTGLRLFHNHMSIELVLEVFGGRNAKADKRIRQVIFEEFLNTDLPGMIFTFMWAFDAPSDWEYIQSLTGIFEEKGAEIYCVELVADQAERLRRNGTENRLANKASKRDVEASTQRIIKEDAKYRLVSLPGEIPFKNYLRIDNTHLSPEDAAKQIVEHFGLSADNG